MGRVTESSVFDTPLQRVMARIFPSAEAAEAAQERVASLDKLTVKFHTLMAETGWDPWKDTIPKIGVEFKPEEYADRFLVSEWMTPLYYTDLYQSLPHRTRVKLNHGFYSLMLKSFSFRERAVIKADHLLMNRISIRDSTNLQHYLRREASEEYGHTVMFDRLGYAIYDGVGSLSFKYRTMANLAVYWSRIWFFYRHIANINLHLVENEIYLDESLPQFIRDTHHHHYLDESRHMAFARNLTAVNIDRFDAVDRWALRQGVKDFSQALHPGVMDLGIRTQVKPMIRMFEWAGVPNAAKVYKDYKWMILYNLNPGSARIGTKFLRQLEHFATDVIPDKCLELRENVIQQMRDACQVYVDFHERGIRPREAYGMLAA